ncbi:MAG: ABC transporter permease [Hyphomicrobiales bacterium]
MIPSIRRTTLSRFVYGLYIAAFFVYLFAPLVVVGVFAFNDSRFPSPPWQGFTLDWFVGTAPGKLGLFSDPALLRSIGVSMKVAFFVTILSVAAGLANAFLLERGRFPGKGLLYGMMLWPLVIPGVILGISILLFSSNLANFIDDRLGIEVAFLRPGIPLVVLGQFSFITSITTTIILARLKKFDLTLEEAALNLGATRAGALRTVTLPFLKPAILGAAIIALLMSFENFNTTLMLVGSQSPLTIHMYGMMREGTTPVVNAVSLMLILGSALLAAAAAIAGSERRR